MLDENTSSSYYDQNPDAMAEYQNQPPMWENGVKNGLKAFAIGFRVIYRIIWEFFWRWWK